MSEINLISEDRRQVQSQSRAYLVVVASGLPSGAKETSRVGLASSGASFFFFGLIEVDEDFVVLLDALCIDSRGTTMCGVRGGVIEGGVEQGVELGVMLFELVLGERRFELVRVLDEPVA